MLQVNWTVMKEWVAKRVTELLGIEEEVLISMIHNHLIDQVRKCEITHPCLGVLICIGPLPAVCVVCAGVRLGCVEPHMDTCCAESMPALILIMKLWRSCN